MLLQLWSVQSNDRYYMIWVRNHRQGHYSNIFGRLFCLMAFLHQRRNRMIIRIYRFNLDLFGSLRWGLEFVRLLFFVWCSRLELVRLMCTIRHCSDCRNRVGQLKCFSSVGGNRSFSNLWDQLLVFSRSHRWLLRFMNYRKAPIWRYQ